MKTNKKGEIEILNFLPGKYYIQETNAKDGYLLSNELIEFDISYNQELTLTINNLLNDEPKFEKEESKITKTVEQKKIQEKAPTKEITETNIKKLPVTGM